MFNKQKIHWMLDESIGHCKPNLWKEVVKKEVNLVNLIGNSNYKHLLPDPVQGLEKIIKSLKAESFSCIIDLTGWLTPTLEGVFPFTTIVNNFSLSRVREVSAPSLNTSGYTISMSPNEINVKKQEINLDKPLIVDDTTFTGWTNIKTMELWGINPAKTTHAFLIANTGFLDNKMQILGAEKKLKSLGSNVIYGHELSTPSDDGWHLKDLHDHKNIPEAFDMSLELLKLIEKEGDTSSITSKFINSEKVLRTIFPNAIDSKTISNMISEGRFIPSQNLNLSSDAIHSKNPFLWASQYFKEHIDFKRVINLRREIVENLIELQSLTSDPEGKIEAANELKRIMQERANIEGNSAVRHER